MITATAPVRVCDIGGWTDTWFGGPGRIVNVAVAPGAVVTLSATGAGDGVILDIEAFGDRYPIIPGMQRKAGHPLLEAAIDALPPPSGLGLEVAVRSDIPPGCGTGTSAAVTVALIAAMAAARDEHPAAAALIRMAHQIEVDVLGGESGVQDQTASALGGISYLEIDHYPEANTEHLPLWPDLNDRLTLVYLGRAHRSSAIHRRVIERVGSASLGSRRAFDALRSAASAARDAILAQDLAGLGKAMIANTAAQGSLDYGLVGADARRIIDLSRQSGAVGWKVNGAGGDGGSISILSRDRSVRDRLERQVLSLDRSYRILPVALSDEGTVVHGTL